MTTTIRFFRNCTTIAAVIMTTTAGGATSLAVMGLPQSGSVADASGDVCRATEYARACEAPRAVEVAAVAAPTPATSAADPAAPNTSEQCAAGASQLSANMQLINPDEYRRTVRTRRADLVKRIHVAGERLGVAPDIVEGIAWTESRFNPAARSPDGLTAGVFQLTQVTAAEMRRRMARSAEGLSLNDEVTLGTGYLRYLSGLFARPVVLDDAGNTTTAVTSCQERWRFAIAAYNAGEGRVAQAQRRAEQAGLDPTRFHHIRPYLPRITRRYVDTVLTFAALQRADALQAS
jgi:soluble lytic murein transglycosylase-like protein